MKHQNKGAKFQDGWRQKKEKKKKATTPASLIAT